MPLETWPVDKLVPYDRNPRTHTPEQVAQIAASIRQFGFTNPILADPLGRIIAGHGRLQAAKVAGLTEVPVIVLAHLSETQRRALVIADNQLALNAGWDDDLLAGELAALRAEDFDLSVVGFTDEELSALLDGEPSGGGGRAGNESLQTRFGVPPFSVLDARQGYWQDRKRAWLALGIESELGRGEALLGLDQAADAKKRYDASDTGRLTYATGAPRKDAVSKRILAGGRRVALTWSGPAKEFDHYRVKEGTRESTLSSGTSIFDPVLCELVYRWFCRPGGVVLDPFAGGSVRGIVASKLGRGYVGIDLRPEQVQANEEQAKEICDTPTPWWHTGDARDVQKLAAGTEADLVFSCPPYGDLERYSDDPRDLSTLTYDEFLDAYREIIAGAVAMLRQDRFACFVVGDFRDGDGCYRGFVSATERAFRDAGLRLHNEAILVTAIGSLPIRAGRQFEIGRKLGKTHQNVLVFVKGDPRAATEAIGEVEFGLPLDEAEGEPAAAEEATGG